jgi:predicted nucleotidyltransferase
MCVPEASIERLSLPLRETLKEVVERIVTGYGPVEKFLLFGSAARGEQDEASDLDLIVIKHTTERFVAQAAFGSGSAGCDVFVYTPEEFASMQEHGSWSMAAASTVII